MMAALGPLRWSIITVYSLGCALLLIATGSIDEVFGVFFGLVVCVWMIAPIAMLALKREGGALTAIGAVLLGAVGFYMYWRAFYGPDVDALSGLAYVILPIYQCVAAAGVVLLAHLIKKSS
ncbi:hypothetical protein QWY75_09910 [Pontixanthobacter aestiaquae]|uniref:Sodium:solute symporter family protein n=1 Tax=Pontixanthobacter aestiaquae TaxID=1509367 RepID=A0A844Z198_9SPHN|nr:hypothetical protein [Pontixanthobacter aestiaquae]MDN3646511.1 hypothetical protein [Pontixanthobacter aestiaquae]MXO82501.1 hypothetical protein [Pontixanthobacter aestiaquae]